MPALKQICFLLCLGYGIAGMAQGNSVASLVTEIQIPETPEIKTTVVAEPVHDVLPSEGLSFYFRQGQRDATLELGLVFSSEQDELDYWKDQRAYERELYKQNVRQYTAYLLAKQTIYASHSNQSSDSCEHGDYFHLRASFYSQFTTEDAAVLMWFQGFNAKNSLAGVVKH